MATPAVALLQQHDAPRDILIELVARWHAAIQARGHSELGAFGTGGIWNWGHNRAVKTKPDVLATTWLSICMRSLLTLT